MEDSLVRCKIVSAFKAHGVIQDKVGSEYLATPAQFERLEKAGCLVKAPEPVKETTPLVEKPLPSDEESEVKYSKKHSRKRKY